MAIPITNFGNKKRKKRRQPRLSLATFPPIELKKQKKNHDEEPRFFTAKKAKFKLDLFSCENSNCSSHSCRNNIKGKKNKKAVEFYLSRLFFHNQTQIKPFFLQPNQKKEKKKVIIKDLGFSRHRMLILT
jgi:hypothetical protein